MSAVPMSPFLTPLPRIAKRPCKCGKSVRVAYDLDGNRIDLEIEPTRAGSFVTIAAWTQWTVYVGEPDAGEFVPDAERFAKHVHAQRGSQMEFTL